MLGSHRWICELAGVGAQKMSATEMAEKLTGSGITIDGILPFARGLEGVVIAEVRGKRAHPEKDKLTLVEVFDGEAQYELVCGAPNVPMPGGRVLLAKVGAKLPNGMEIAERSVAGVTSRGMLCSEAELGIGSESDGIVVLGESEAHAKTGASFASALGIEDFIFDISLTPNRPDCLGHVGLAREIAALSQRPFSPQFARAELDTGTATSFAVPVAIASPDRCTRYAGAIVRGTSARPSPLYVRARLHSLGVRAINAIVDATNWVLFESSQPTHAFDVRSLRGSRIDVRTAKAGERMTTLDGIERELALGDLLICDGEGPVAIAGVMGGANSEVKADTTDVMLECAYFEPRGVRRTSRRLGLHTDASHRFERGIDPTTTFESLCRLAHVVTEFGGGSVEPLALDVHPKPYVAPCVTIRHARVDALLGTHVEPSETKTWLTGAGFAIESETNERFVVSVPGHRPDVLREVDLIEEVARLRGYDSIPTADPLVRPSTEGTSQAVRFARRLKERAVAIGLDEAVNLSFVSDVDLDAACAPASRIVLANPLSADRTTLRSSLLAGLANDLRRAQRHQVEGARLFEIARVFENVGDILPRETTRLGVLLAGPRGAFLGDTVSLDVYDLKGVLTSLLEPLTGASLVTPQTDAIAHESLHPRRSAFVVIGDRTVGTMGELHPDVVEKFELTGRPVYAELDLDVITELALSQPVRRFVEMPKFPSVSRDHTFTVAKPMRAGDLTALVPSDVDGVRVTAGPVGVYEGAGVPEGAKNLSLRFTYRDPALTLTDDRVSKAHESIVRKLEAAIVTSRPHAG